MSPDHTQDPHHHHQSIAWRWHPRRRPPLLRRRKVHTVLLGGKRRGRRTLFVVRMLRKMRLKWLKLQYQCMIRKLKEYYRSVVRDMVEAGATVETFQRRLFMEATFAVPVGVALSSFPSVVGSDRPRTAFIL